MRHLLHGSLDVLGAQQHIHAGSGGAAYVNTRPQALVQLPRAGINFVLGIHFYVSAHPPSKLAMHLQ